MPASNKVAALLATAWKFVRAGAPAPMMVVMTTGPAVTVNRQGVAWFDSEPAEAGRATATVTSLPPPRRGAGRRDGRG